MDLSQTFISPFPSNGSLSETEFIAGSDIGLRDNGIPSTQRPSASQLKLSLLLCQLYTEYVDGMPEEGKIKELQFISSFIQPLLIQYKDGESIAVLIQNTEHILY